MIRRSGIEALARHLEAGPGLASIPRLARPAGTRQPSRCPRGCNNRAILPIGSGAQRGSPSSDRESPTCCEGCWNHRVQAAAGGPRSPLSRTGWSVFAEYGVATTREAAARIPVGNSTRLRTQCYVSKLHIGWHATCHHSRRPHVPTVRRTAPPLESATNLHERRRRQESVDHPAISPAPPASQRIGKCLRRQRPLNYWLSD